MKKFIQKFRSLLGLVLFILTLLVIQHMLRKYHYHDIVHQLKEIPRSSLVLSMILTLLNYSLLSVYDMLALRYIRYSLAYSKIALGSFIGYVFSYNLTVFGGGAARYRIYSSWGLSALNTAKLVMFCGLTLWLGFFAISGLAFLFEPMVLPAFLHLPFTTSRPIAVILLMLLGGYILWTVLRRKPVIIKGLEFPPPRINLTLVQIAIGSLDWILAGSVLYVLLPRSAILPFPKFLGIFLLAQLSGLVSQIPAGLGAFEMVSLFLLSPAYSATTILGVLLVYRVVYYLFPFIIASGLLVIHELLERKKTLKWIGNILGQWAPIIIPDVFAFMIFLGGAILLFSGALPAEKGRLEWLRDLVPLTIVEVSHFIASLIGMGLLVLARSLQRRLDAAYHSTIILLILGIILSLLKGLDYEEAIILSIMLTALLPCHREFRRKSLLFGQSLTFPWIAAIVIVLLSSIWLGIFSYKHVEYSNSLWWQFAFHSDAPRFLRATSGVVVFSMILALAMLLRPVFRPPAREQVTDLQRVQPIIENSRHTYANLALLGDKTFILNKTDTAFIMYAVEGQSWIAMGDPVGPEQEWQSLIWQFREACDQHGCLPVFYEVDGKNLFRYAYLGLTSLKIGEEARVSLESFSLEGSVHKNLRYTLHKFEKLGYEFKVLFGDEVRASLLLFRKISEAWLNQKNTSEKGFSLGFFTEEYIKLFPAAIVRKEGETLAFANLWCGAEKEELSIDLMRYYPDSPEGLMDYLFTQIMLWGKREGYRWFNLGMAPLSGLVDMNFSRLWIRFGSFVFRYGEHFYNFQGLRRYKEKFKPEWYPKYLICPGGLTVPRILNNLLSLTSGGLKGAVSK